MPHKQQSHKILDAVFFHLGDSPASEFYVVTLQITLSHHHGGEDGTECSKTLPHTI
jgi:hypothetical protein